MSHYSKYFISNVAQFGKLGGLDKIKNYILSPEPKVNLTQVRNLLKATSRIRNFVNQSLIKDFVDKTIQRTFSLILDTSDDDFRLNSRQTMTEISSCLHSLLSEVSQSASEVIEPFSMKLALKCFEFHTLDKRLAGLNDIKGSKEISLILEAISITKKT